MLFFAAETVINTAPSLDNQVWVAAIAAVSGIITTWLTVKYKDKIIRKNAAPQKPKDRMDRIFDGYEKLIIQQQHEIDRKTAAISNLETIVGKLEDELAATKELLSETKTEVAESRDQNAQLKAYLKKMRIEYEPAHNS